MTECGDVKGFTCPGDERNARVFVEVIEGLLKGAVIDSIKTCFRKNMTVLTENLTEDDETDDVIVIEGRKYGEPFTLSIVGVSFPIHDTTTCFKIVEASNSLGEVKRVSIMDPSHEFYNDWEFSLFYTILISRGCEGDVKILVDVSGDGQLSLPFMVYNKTHMSFFNGEVSTWEIE